MSGNVSKAIYALCNGLYFMTDWCSAKEAIKYHQSIVYACLTWKSIDIHIYLTPPLIQRCALKIVQSDKALGDRKSWECVVGAPITEVDTCSWKHTHTHTNTHYIYMYIYIYIYIFLKPKKLVIHFEKCTWIYVALFWFGPNVHYLMIRENMDQIDIQQFSFPLYYTEIKICEPFQAGSLFHVWQNHLGSDSIWRCRFNDEGNPFVEIKPS